MRIEIVDIERGREAYACEEVAKLISQGYTSGIDPTWDLTEEGDEEDDD